jgi:hypothetical protein
MLRKRSYPSAVQRALGCFVAWQLCFLGMANVLEFFPRRSIESGVPADALPWQVRWPFDRWSELTAQWQSWAFFAPQVPRASAFVEVQLHWQDRHETLRSPFEPADPQRYFDPVLSSIRLFNYDWKQAMPLVIWREGGLGDDPRLWQPFMTGALSVHGEAWASFLRWRLQRYRLERPDSEMPRQLVLVGRTYATPPPGSQAGHSVLERPIAAWRPFVASATGRPPLEIYDPETGRFDFPAAAER